MQNPNSNSKLVTLSVCLALGALILGGAAFIISSRGGSPQPNALQPGLMPPGSLAPGSVLPSSGFGPNRTSAQEATDKQEKELGIDVVIYTQKNDEKMPDMSSPDSFKAAVMGAQSSPNPQLFVHLGSGKPFIPNANLTGLTPDSRLLATPSKTILLYAPEPDDGKRGVGFADGHVEWIPEADWPARKTAGNAP